MATEGIKDGAMAVYLWGVSEGTYKTENVTPGWRQSVRQTQVTQSTKEGTTGGKNMHSKLPLHQLTDFRLTTTPDSKLWGPWNYENCEYIQKVAILSIQLDKKTKGKESGLLRNKEP